ncbi:hypothetical protein HHI36_021321 [Cryptolaemus montrouzieri]|uniref:Uncharacterized protein n=1 Tax=Cryptolaemus montrouzieri TaxID=559131 RepID=A0ABD2MWE5_9CUCU
MSAAFGGNINNVILFGLSVCSASISLLFHAKRTADLYHRGLKQSHQIEPSFKNKIKTNHLKITTANLKAKLKRVYPFKPLLRLGTVEICFQEEENFLIR